MIKLLQILFFILCPVLLIHAQFEINGSLDLEVSKGGKDSRFVTNEIANDFQNPHLAISQFNLFVFSQINESFTFNGRIQFDNWGTGQMSYPRITLAMLTWEPEGSGVAVTLGRYISPFGLYPRRILAADNLFAQVPLAYGYFLNISDKRGYWPKAGDSGVYGSDDVGLTTIYFGGYNTGGLLSWIIIPDKMNIDIAVANAAVASQAPHTNLANIGGIARLGLQPVIFWQQGISFSYGTFMQKDGINSIYDGFEEFKQMAAGTDLVLAYSHFELSGEIIYSMWDVPMFAGGTFFEDAPRSLASFKLSNYSGYADFKIEPPFLTGLYVAVRYDILKFVESDDIKSLNSNNFNPWDNDITRYSAAVGYKFARSILLKIAYMNQKTENVTTDPEDYTIRSILTVSF